MEIRFQDEDLQYELERQQTIDNMIKIILDDFYLLGCEIEEEYVETISYEDNLIGLNNSLKLSLEELIEYENESK